MPLPLGHAAVGLAVYELFPGEKTTLGRLKAVALVSILSNLPDVDVILGLLFQWNGSAFHRGPTHSLVFAVAMGLLASRAWRAWAFIPRMSAWAGTAIITSHLLADRFLSGGPVSLSWPLAVSYSTGHTGWGEVVRTVAYDGWQDNGIILVASVFIVAVRFAKSRLAVSGEAFASPPAAQPAVAPRALRFKN
jgi:membrane-bound metal-dependent hydrolase YbcI (DUF457 family)